MSLSAFVQNYDHYTQPGDAVVHGRGLLTVMIWVQYPAATMSHSCWWKHRQC